MIHTTFVAASQIVASPPFHVGPTQDPGPLLCCRFAALASPALLPSAFFRARCSSQDSMYLRHLEWCTAYLCNLLTNRCIGEESITGQPIAGGGDLQLICT